MIARIVLLATTALPVVGLTVLAAGLRLAGWLPAGPAAGTFFANLGPLWSGLVPLLLVIAGLVGFAVRERSAGYAFSAGLVLELAVTLGYALATMTGLMTRPPTVVFWVTLLQLATITAAAWAIAWLLARQALDVWREGAAFRNTVLMNVQLGMAGAGNFLLLGWALLLLVLLPRLDIGRTGALPAGLPLGLARPGAAAGRLAIAGAVASATGRAGRHGRAGPVGLHGPRAGSVLAFSGATAGRCDLGLSHADARLGRLRAAGRAGHLVGGVAADAARRGGPAASDDPHGGRLGAGGGYSRRAAGTEGRLLAAADYREELWAAAAIAVASVAGATMAVWRRREGWAFVGRAGVNLAASLVVWHFAVLGTVAWRIGGCGWSQANVIASAAVALAWLAARRRLYQLRDFTLGQSPLLALQVALPAAGCMALLALPVGWLVCIPAGLPAWTAGWPAAGLDRPAGGRGRRRPGIRDTPFRPRVHVLGFLLLGVGVLLACHAGQGGYWFGYHVLTTAWAAATLALLGLAMSAEKFRVVRRNFSSPAASCKLGSRGSAAWPCCWPPSTHCTTRFAPGGRCGRSWPSPRPPQWWPSGCAARPMSSFPACC